MTAAAKLAGVTLRTVQRYRFRNFEFEKAEVDALQMAIESAESEAFRRAIDGVERIHFHTDKDGAVHEHKERKYSDTMLLRLLERLETGSWRQKQQPEARSGRAIFATRIERKAALEKARSELASARQKGQ
jgi:hypothetical protein